MNGKRIGILGGMYDPVHYGHLRAAIEVRELLGLNEVRLVPCAVPPHREAPGVSAALRSEMLAAALHGIEGLTLDARELELPAPSYTLRTLQSLRQEMPAAVFVLLLGEDAFQGLHRWHEWRTITELAHVAVLRRPGNDGKAWPEPLRDWISENECTPERLFHNDARSGCLTFCRIPALDISSTRIRDLRRARRNPRFLLPDAVLDIIEREDLYRGEQT